MDENVNEPSIRDLLTQILKQQEQILKQQEQILKQQEQQEQHHQEQMVVLGEKMNELLAKNENPTIVLSSASKRAIQDFLDRLTLPERGASWDDKPDFSTGIVDTFNWLDYREDHEENRNAYMQYLQDYLAIPNQTHSDADAKPYPDLLKVEVFPGTDVSRKISGTTHVVIVKLESLTNHALRNNVIALFELKKPGNLASRDHTAQFIGEHFAASCLNRYHPVVSVLTDLNNSWTFYWYAQADKGRIVLFSLNLSGAKAATEAKYLLDSLYEVEGRSLPITFSSRLSFEEAFSRESRNGREVEDGNVVDDDDDGDDYNYNSGGNRTKSSTGKNSKLSSSNSGVSSSGSRGTSHSNNQYNASMSLANTLGLFAPPSYRDVANELDLLDMLDENEQFEIVRSFAMKHVVPYMKGSLRA